MHLIIEPYGDCTLNEGNAYLIFFPETPAEKDILTRLGLGKTPKTALLPVNMDRIGKYFKEMKVKDILSNASKDVHDFFSGHLQDKIEDLPLFLKKCALFIVFLQTANILVTSFVGMDETSIRSYLSFIKHYSECLKKDKIIIAVSTPLLGWDFKELRVVNLATTKVDVTDSKRFMEHLYGQGSRRDEVEFKFKAPEPKPVKRLKKAIRYFRYLLIVLLIIFIVKILPWILLGLFWR